MPKELRTGRSDEFFTEYVVAYIEKGGERFEILVKPDAVQKLRDGENVDILANIAIDQIFRDSRKGTRASEEKMQEFFGTTNHIEVARKLILDGDIQLTTQQRRDMTEAKKKQIIAYIATNAINPQTGAPHPAQRIEIAFGEANVRIDPFKSIEEQIKTVLDAIRPLIPIRFEKTKIAIKLSAEDCAKCYGEIKNYGQILQEEWQPSGSWIGVVEIPGGLQSEFIERLSEKTKGNVETKILRG